MNKRTFVGVVLVATAVVLLTTALLASNMAFRLNKQLLGAGVAGAASGENHIAIPFIPRTNVVDAEDVLNDIEGGCGDVVVSVQRFSPTLGFRESYTGGKVPGTNFPLAACNSYFVQMNSAADCAYTIVGSHDPTVQCTFNGSGVAGFVTGENNYGPPYHMTAVNAADLLGSIPNAASVQRFNTQTGFRETWVGGKIAGTNFSVTPGEGYFIQMNPGTTASIVPDHY